MTTPKIIFRVHAVQRMFERSISVLRVTQAVRTGKIIEDYSTEMPEPSWLIGDVRGKRPVHVVISKNRNANEILIITAYFPDPGKWNKDLTSRRS